MTNCQRHNSKSADYGGYRYFFNGQESDAEAYGQGGLAGYEFRQYDTRLGRWWGVDPEVGRTPSLSAFTAFRDNPIPFMSWVSPYPKIDYKRGYFYQLHKYRMAYLLMQDENDSILRLAYYNPLHPVMFPKNGYNIITPSGEPITYTDEYAVHIRRYEKDGVSLFAVPYLFDYITETNSKSKSKHKRRIEAD